MLVTRTIRRKMVTWLVLLAVMVCALAASSITGLRSYKRTVEDLEFSIRSAPRSAELVSAISLLIPPCSIDVPHDKGVARDVVALRQKEDLLRALTRSQQGVADFRRRLNELPNSPQRSELEESPYRAIFSVIDGHFRHLKASAERLTNADRDENLKFILTVVSELLQSVNSIPDPALELTNQLQLTKSDYEWRLKLVWGTALISAFVFALLIYSGYRWVFAPLSQLHQGAMRVANGSDFDFRIDSCSKDELGELAEAFNQMTSRFQQVREDLDQQVQQRSRQLVQSERLAGVGFLAAGVAHEINNPLSAIVGAADSLEWRLSEHLEKFPEADAEVIREYLHMMQSEAQRCRQITEKMLNFARGADSERNLYDVTAIVQEVVGMTQHLGRFRDRTLTVDNSTPCYAWVNGPEIKQVVLNLIANALEASPPGGKVAIGIREYAQNIEVTVTDEGVGMTPDVLEHIFEPFFTRREAGKGTGLGLSISHRIVQDHNGSIEATSPGPGKGSTFRLRVPREEQSSTKSSTWAA